MNYIMLDLFCGAGGCSRGYANAGFKIVGVDKEPQKRYPYEFIQADVFGFMQNYYLPGKFHIIHASPPCQRYSKATSKKYRDSYLDIIPKLRQVLEKTGLPYIIENVPGSPLLAGKTITLCGTMFNLGVFRHRLFETNFKIKQPKHEIHTGRIGDGHYFSVAGNSGGWTRWGKSKIIHKGRIGECQRAMGVAWMTRRELVQAIPPAYTQFIGETFVKLEVMKLVIGKRYETRKGNNFFREIINLDPDTGSVTFRTLDSQGIPWADIKRETMDRELFISEIICIPVN